jgi:N-acetylglucosamine-6-sulfatase
VGRNRQTRVIPALALCAAAALGLASGAAPAAASPPPNIVVIVTDDQTAASLTPAVMPATSRMLVDRGISFDQAIVSDPQCCPSRATMYTGQYAHNNGVISNVPGYPLLQDKGEILPHWLAREGYTTIHIGKYLNGTGETIGAEPAPGWDRWLTALQPNYISPVFSIDGEGKRFEGGYLTSIENRMATRMIKRYAPRRRPFYLHLDQFAPHQGVGVEGERCGSRAAVPAPADRGLFQGVRAPRPPGYDEDDVSDKPSFIQELPRFDSVMNLAISIRYGCALASLREVDRGVTQLMAALRRSGELSRTMIVFVSDNGYSFGEHRFPGGKGLPYEEDLRVPMVIRPPASLHSTLPPGSVLDDPVANVDLAPTLLDVAGGRPCVSPGECRTMDGRSLVPLLRGHYRAWTEDRAIATEFFANTESRILSCAWEGFRTPGQVFIRNTSVPDEGDRCVPGDERELYDLAADPFELENLAAGSGAESPDATEAAVRSDRLRACAGIAGRDRRTGDRPFCE